MFILFSSGARFLVRETSSSLPRMSSDEDQEDMDMFKYKPNIAYFERRRHADEAAMAIGGGSEESRVNEVGM